MKIKFVFILIISSFSNVFANQTTYEKMRMLFIQATSSEKSCIKLLNLCSQHSNFKDATVLGYKACATMLMAKYAINPLIKWSKFSTGRNLLENAVNKEPSNIELRYLRHCIQTNSPTFLGYNNNISNDKIFLINGIVKLKDEELKKLIVNYLAQSDNLINEK